MLRLAAPRVLFGVTLTALACGGGGDGVGVGGKSNFAGGEAGGGSSSNGANGGTKQSFGGGGGQSSGGRASGGDGQSAGGKASGGGGQSLGGRASGGDGQSAGGKASGGASGAAASGGMSGACDPGSTTTKWATGCPTSAPACTTGTWLAGGPDPDHAGYALIKESAHFAIYSDESVSEVNAQSALDTLENRVWTVYFGNPIYFREPLCTQTTKYKVSVHVNSANGLTGGAWTTNRMGMWIGPSALSDHWGLAHEFMHGVQSVSGGMSCAGTSNYCGWVYESHANFMPHQLAEYRNDVHCSEMSFNMPHLYLGSTRDRYCNWQFMEFLKDKYCYAAVNAIWTQSAANDPFTNIMKGLGWDISQLNDFIGEWAMHNVTWDYKNPDPKLPNDDSDPAATFRAKYGLITDVSQPVRRLRTTRLVPLDEGFAQNRRFATPSYAAPQRFGYNVVRLFPDTGASHVRVTFRGVTRAMPSPDWRWGLVATNAALTSARYGALQRGSDGFSDFCVSPGESLWLVVAATPSVQQHIVWDQPYASVPRYPYLVGLEGAWPDGFQGGAQAACPSGLSRVKNGGGCAPANLPDSVYVGPYATVLSGATVSGNARVEDHATVLSGSVSGGTLGAMALVSAFNMRSGSAKTTFYPLGFFESNQGLSGGTLVGDVEYRGAGLSRSSGTCAGFVDSSTCVAPGSDATPEPPYAWR